MFIPVFVVAVVVSVVISIFRAKKIAEERREEERRRAARARRAAQTRAQNKTGVKKTSAKKTAPKNGARRSNAKAEPFPDYGVNPFADVHSAATGTLSPAQYNAWLLEFASAEKAGMSRPRASGTPSPFGEYLQNSGFTRRQTRKLHGYAPQNRLIAALPARKYKASFEGTLPENGGFTRSALLQKSTLRYGAPQQRVTIAPLPLKTDWVATYASFYEGKD